MNNEQNSMKYDPYTGVPIYTAPTKQSYSIAEIIFGWLCLLGGYAFCRIFPVMEHPFGGLLYIVAIFVVAVIVLKCKGCRFGLMPVVMSISVAMLLPALFLSGNGMIHFLVFGYAQLVWCYFVFAVGGGPLENGFSDLLLTDFFKAVIVLPFVSLGKLFSAIFFRRGKGGKIFLKILLGVFIAILPTVIVIALLSYDQVFMNLLKKLFDISWRDFFSHFFSFVFGIPIGMYFFGLFYSSTRGKCAGLDAEQCRRISNGMKILPQITTFAAALPLLVIYGVFFASQWELYLSAFSGILPESFTPAQYAREGFSQLSVVSVINMVLIIAMQLFVRRRNNRPEWLTKILSIAFSCITLGLIATAFSKLYLYITRFGLTPKRVYAGWFMLILAVLFLMVIAKQLFHRFRLIPSATLVCVALFAVLALSGSDRLIAKYNVDRYLDGSLRDVDVEAMEELGDAAIPELVRLAQTLDAKNGTDIAAFEYDVYDFYSNYLYNRVGYALLDAAGEEEGSLYSLTLPHQQAMDALRSAGIIAREKTDYWVNTNIRTFNYEEEKKYIESYDSYVKDTGFVNAVAADCDDVEMAVARAKAECTFYYEDISVYRDAEKEMWKIIFYDDDGGRSMDVYIGYDGITQLTVIRTETK